jgi:hypothetical protein
MYIYEIAYTLIHSVLYVLNFMLSMYGPNLLRFPLHPKGVG